jgi:hypothetical protein
MEVAVNDTVSPVPKLFLPQTTLEEWVVEEKVDLQEDTLVVLEEKARFPLTPAVHFTAVVSGNDERKLVQKVKSKAQLDSMAAEQMMDSVILGEDAYETVSGFTLEVTSPTQGKKAGSETELLAEFLLNKLS